MIMRAIVAPLVALSILCLRECASFGNHGQHFRRPYESQCALVSNSGLRQDRCTLVSGSVLARKARPLALFMGKRKDEDGQSRTHALNFRDADTSDITLEMPVELIKKRSTTSTIFPILEEVRSSSSVASTIASQNSGEVYWMDYTLRVSCDSYGKRSSPSETLAVLESSLSRGEMSESEFDRAKGLLIKDFWSSLVSDGTTQRSISCKEINVQVSNSPQFIDSWIRKNVLDDSIDTLGLAISWNGQNISSAPSNSLAVLHRGRIALVQLSANNAILVVQMALLPSPRLPDLLRSVLENPRIRKVGCGTLMDAAKLQKDWSVRVIGRVDSLETAVKLDYLASGTGASLPAMARSVLALDYEPPSHLARADWDSVSLTEMQITCAALEAWIPREALAYLEALTGTAVSIDVRDPATALALPSPQQSFPSPRFVSRRAASRRETATLQRPVSPQKRQSPRDINAIPKILYLPKIDIREGGNCAHWIWRGLRVSDSHLAAYCGVEIEVSNEDVGDATLLRIWGEDKAIREASTLLSKLLARSQVESHCLALGMALPTFVDRPTSEGGVQSTAMVNQMELVDWSFFPSRLTLMFTGIPYVARGQGGARDLRRAAFFAQADAAARAADELLGPHRPAPLAGPLPLGLDPGLMWRVAGYSLS